MSVRELRERIAEFDAEINLQKELLKKLERDKSFVQRQLNNVLDPVARLPPEISSEILLQCLNPFPDHEAHRVPMLLLSICHAWTDIALSTPALWAAIHISFPCTSGFREILPVWLERARNRPLSISIQMAGVFDEEVVATIWRHGHQLKKLELYEMWREDGLGILGGATPGPLPSLETLTTRSGQGWEFTLHHILELLRQSPNLVEYFIETSIYDDGAEVENVSLPKLRRLMFGTLGTCPDGGEGLLERLSLPSLEALSTDASGGTLLAFLRKSSPPLLELTFNIGYGPAFDFFALAQFLPDLACLEVWYPGYQALKDLFAALALQYPLPRLHTLVVHLDHRQLPNTCDAFWITLSRALVARRTQIQFFRLTILSRPRASQTLHSQGPSTKSCGPLVRRRQRTWCQTRSADAGIHPPCIEFASAPSQ